MDEEFAMFLKSFEKHEKFMLHTKDMLILLKKYNDEFNNTHNISEETVYKMTEKFLTFVKDVTTIIGGDSGSLFIESIKSIAKEADTVISGVNFLHIVKKYCKGDASAVEMIDSACNLIEKVTSKFPIVGPVVGPLFNTAAREIFNGINAEATALNSNADLIQRFLDMYYLKTSSQDYNTYLLENVNLSEIIQGQTTQLGGGVILIPNFQGVKSISGTSNNDSIENNSDSTYIYGLAGDDSITNNGYNLKINGSTGQDTITNKSGNVEIYGGDGNDRILNTGGSRSSYVTIDGGAGSDFVSQKGDAHVSVNGGDGNDHIENYGYDNITLTGNTGDDYIHNWTFGTKTTIDGDSGNDYIDNKGSDVLLKGGSDSDTIVTGYHPLGGSNVTISGGTGNDLIILESYAGKNLILYESGDGFDIIQGFKNHSTLKIGNGSGTYSKAVSGNDIIITARNGKITLTGAKNLSTINIQGKEVSVPKWTLSDTTATYGTSTETFITVWGVKSLEGINLNDNIVNLSANALGTDKITICDGYFLAFGNDVIKSQTNASGWILDGTTATYKNTSISEGYKLDNNQITYIPANGGEILFSLTNVKNTDSIGVNTSKKTVTLSADNLTGKNVSISGDYSLALSGVNPSTSTNAHFDGLTYKSASRSEGYSLSNDKKSISYSPDVAETDLFTLSNVKNTDSVEVDTTKKTVTLNADNLTGKNVSISGDYSLALSGVNPSTSTNAHFDGLTYKSAGSSEGYSLSNDKKSVTYTPAVAETDLFSISGVTSADGFDVIENGSTCLVKITDTALNSATDSTISLVKKNSDAKFIFADNFSGKKEQTVEKAAGLLNGKYSSTSYFKWFDLNENTLTIHPATSAKTFSLSGLSSAAKLDENVIVADGDSTAFTFKAAALDKKSIVITSDRAFSVALDEDVDQTAETIPESIALTNGTLNYTSAGKGEYYSATNSGVSYIPQTARDTFSLSGLGNGAKLNENVSVNGNTIKIKSVALSATHEAINVDNNNYTVELAQDIAKVEEIKFASENGKVTLSGTTAGYAKVGDSYEWQNQIGGEKLTITGLKSGAALTENMFNRSGNVITFKPTQELLPDNLTDQATISITGGVIDTSSLTKTDAEPAQWKGMTRFSAKTASSWTSNAPTVTYIAARGGDELFTVRGLNDTPNDSNISVGDKKITILNAALLKDGASISATNDYTVELSSSLEPSDEISKGWNGNSYYSTDGYKAAGWILSGGKVSKVNALTPAVTVSGVKSNSGLNVNGKTVIVSSPSLNKKTVTINDTGYTLALGNDVTKSSTTNAGWAFANNVASYKAASTSAGYTLADNKISYITASGGETLATVSGVKSLDGISLNGKVVTVSNASVNTKDITISDGYTLVLGSDITRPADVATVYDAKTMTYTTAGKSDGYSLSSDKKSITYNSATSKEFKFSGIANGATASNFYISGNTVTIGKAAVQTNGTPVKLLNQSGYTLKLGKGMEAPTNNAGTLKNGIYTFGGKSTGYILDTKNNTIKYSAATSATLELSGVKSAPTAPTDDTLTLNLANFDKNLSVTSNTGKYKFSIASGTYTGKTFTGSNSNDTISNVGANLIINSGNGNDYIKSTGTSSTIFGGAGNDTMAGSSGADTLSGDAGNDILWGGKGNDSMKGGTGNDSLVGYDDDDRISGDAGNDTILGGNGNDFLYGGTDNDYLEGNASSDTLNGAAGNDTLWGGADNDTLTGGAGNDVFIYKPDEGTDHITDYASGDILQILRTDGTNDTYTKATFASNKLTLTINGGGSIIFDNVSAGDKININGTTRTIAGNTLK